MTGRPPTIARLHWFAVACLWSGLVGCSGEVELGGGDDVEMPGDADTSSDDSVAPAPDTTTTADSSSDAGDTLTPGDTTTSSDTTAPPTPDTTAPPDTTGPSGGELCSGPCDDHAQCGGPDDKCLLNNNTGETFCSQACADHPDCPTGFQCAEIHQCVPVGQSCEPPVPCEPACGTGEVCVDGACVAGGMWQAEQQFCVDEINSYRIAGGLAPLQRSSALEACATAGAQQDSQTLEPHGHFKATQGCGLAARAENEIPGWPGGVSGVMSVIEQGTLAMYNEGPGGGHHDNIMNPSSTAVGCGIHVTAEGDVWVVQDFR